MHKARTELYHALGEVLNYPMNGFNGKLKEIEALLCEEYRDACVLWQKFIDALNEKKNAELEELYVRTFDVQAVSSLDIGYVLFGEDYKRGVFMAELKKELRAKNIDCGSELPDYLPNLMHLIPILADEEKNTLATHALLPALEKMLGNFKDTENPYQYLLEIIHHLIEKEIHNV